MKSLDNQFEYWNSVSESEIFNHPLDIDRFCSVVSKYEKILDFGCGYGRVCNELYRMGYQNIVGVDSSKAMIERGRKIFPHLHLKAINNKLPYESDVFDTVILFAVLTCIPTNKGQKALIKEIFRVLHPGGVIYISDYWLQSDDRNLKRYNEFKDKYDIYGVFESSGGAIVRHHEKDWILSLLANFQTLELYDTEETSLTGNKSLCFQYVGRKKNNL